MKKIYSIPETKVVTIKNICVLSGSPAIGLNTSGSVAAANVDSRQDNSWDIWGTGDYDEE